MAALPGIFGLLVFIYMRPHEFVDAFADLPLLYVFLGLAAIGILFDIRAGDTRLVRGPQLTWVLAFVAWCLFSLAVNSPSSLRSGAIGIAVSLTLFLVLAHGVQTIGEYKRILSTIFALGFFVAAVGLHQHFADTGCVIYNPGDRTARSYADGRPCSTESEGEGERVDGSLECYESGQPGFAYTCENVGLFGTTSIGSGRVRYLGVLADPNELALATALAVPFAFAFFEQKKGFFRLLLLLLTIGVVAGEIVFTQSRGGQLVFGAVLGAYFVKRYGWKKGALVAAILMGPLMLYGGRQSEEADQSSLDRLEAAAAGIQMLMQSPFWGVGFTRFPEHHDLTAHNAYILAAGELGFVGMVLFCMVLLVSAKIPIAVLNAKLEGPLARVQPLAMAMLAAFGGIVIGIFFLSWTYHYVLWIHFGLAGALYAVVKARAPGFRVRVGIFDVAGVTAFCAIVLVALTLYTRHKNAW